MFAANYDLKQVKLAAERLNIEYRGRKVAIDIANLGYDIHDVARCLCQLKQSDFRKSHQYPNQADDDEYLVAFRYGAEENMVDHLYIKFSLVDGYLAVDLGAFHLA